VLCTGGLFYLYVLLYVVSDFEGVAFLEEVLIWSRPQGLAKFEWDHSIVEGSACYKAYCHLLFGRVQFRILPGDFLSRPRVFVAFLRPSRQC
jgi:hypothetical protein